jgi:hypothetical protein
VQQQEYALLTPLKSIPSSHLYSPTGGVRRAGGQSARKSICCACPRDGRPALLANLGLLLVDELVHHSRCACNNRLRGTTGLHRNFARLLRGAYLLKIRLSFLNLVVMHIGGAL